MSSPDNAVAHVACPDCGVEIPIGIKVHIEAHDDGAQTVEADLTTDDVWAHAWTHETSEDES